MATPLTERQNDALEFVRAYVREHRKPPTFVEIGRAMNIRSTNAVSKLVRALVDKGYLTHTPNVARGLGLATDDPLAGGGADTPLLPVLGRVSSAQPDRLRARPSAYLAVDLSLLGRAEPDACVVARVGDDGMNGDGIRKGDLVVAEDGVAPRNGDLALVVAGETPLVRRYAFANGRAHLRAADRHYSDLTFGPRDPGYLVVGRVLTVIRRIA